MFPFITRNEARLHEIDRLLPTDELMAEARQIIVEEDLRDRGFYGLFG